MSKVFIIAGKTCNEPLDWPSLNKKAEDKVVCMNGFGKGGAAADCPYFVDYMWMRVARTGRLHSDCQAALGLLSVKTKLFFLMEAEFADGQLYEQFVDYCEIKPLKVNSYDIVSREEYGKMNWNKFPKMGSVIARWAAEYEAFKDDEIYCVNFTVSRSLSGQASAAQSHRNRFVMWHDHDRDDEMLYALERQGKIKFLDNKGQVL